jgi:hypothetical protein
VLGKSICSAIRACTPSQHAEPDGIDEVDNLRAGGAQGAQEGGEYEAVKVEIEYTSVYMRG